MPDEETPTNASMPMEKYSEDGKILIKGPDEESDCSYFEVKEGTLIIGKEAFAGNSVVEEIILPESITDIQDYAFQDCINLKKIELPENVRFIGTGVFLGCKSIESIKIPEGITEINNLFHGCRNLCDVHLPESFKIIGYCSFEGTSNLKEISIPVGLEEIGNRTFRYSQIEHINWPSSLKKLGEEAFQSCLSLKELKIPEGIEKIEGICDGCFELKKVILPNSLRVIGFKSFYKCLNLSEINLPEGLEEISYYAFGECKSLKEIYVPSTIEKIDVEAFNSCSLLEKIWVPLKAIDKIKELLSNNLKPLIKIKQPDMSQTKSNKIDSKSYVIITCGDNVNPEIDRIELKTDPPSFINLKPGENVLTVEEYPGLKYGFGLIKDPNGKYAPGILKLDLSNFDSSQMVSMRRMFADLKIEKAGFQFRPSVEIIFPETDLDTSNVKDMSYLFEDSEIESFFYHKWDTSKVEDMSYMFGMPLDTVEIDLSSFNVNNVKKMEYMIPIYYTEKLILDGWKVSSKDVVKDIFNNNYHEDPDDYFENLGFTLTPDIIISMKGCDADTIKWIAEELVQFIDWGSGDTLENHLILDKGITVKARQGWIVDVYNDKK